MFDPLVSPHVPDPPEADGDWLAAADPLAEVWDATLDGLVEGTVPETVPAGLLLESLLEAAAGDLDADRLLAAIRDCERVIGLVQAVQQRVTAGFADHRPTRPGPDEPERTFSEFAPDEVAFELGLSRNTAAQRLALATDLRDRLPNTLAALERGVIDLPKARMLSDLTAPLTVTQARAVEQRVLAAAEAVPHRTCAQLRAIAQRAVLREDPHGAEQRHRARLRDRRVEHRPAEDGMGELHAYLSAKDSTAIYERLDALATTARTPGDDRTADQRRADVFTDLILGNDLTPRRTTTDPATATTDSPTTDSDTADPATADADATTNAAGSPAQDSPGQPTPGRPATGQPAAGWTGRGPAGGHRCASVWGWPWVRAQVQVIAAATTLAGADELPGELAGYGPIPASMARELAAGGDWRRLLTDPASGALLDFGRRTYRPPAALDAYVRARHRRCAAPGCRLPARRCDLDHTKPYPEGPTCFCNLAPLCRHHHRMKTEGTGWTVTQPNPGVLTWTSPTGRRYTTRPEPLTEPDTPPGETPADPPPHTHHDPPPGPGTPNQGEDDQGEDDQGESEPPPPF